MHSPCPITDVETSVSYVVGSLPPIGEFPTPVHQEQIIAEQVSGQQHTVEQILHVPVPHIQEQIEESVDIPAPSSVDESASPVYNHVHLDQTGGRAYCETDSAFLCSTIAFAAVNFN